jgi:hypothetical protein
MKLHIHVVEVVIEIAFERIARLKISEGRTQPIGAVRLSVQISFLMSVLRIRLTERVGEVHIIDVDKCNPHPARRLVRPESIAVSTNNRAYNYERDASPCRTAHEQWSSSNFVNEENGRDCAKTVDDSVHARCQQRGCVS